MTRTRIKTLLKIVLSLALLGAIIAYSGPSEVLATLGGMRSTLVVLAFALLLADALVRSFNWFQLARGAGCGLPLRAIVQAYFAGGFIGALLPSTLGTDMARSAVAASRSRTPLEMLLATTVLLNLLSLAVISFVGLCVSLGLLALPEAPRGVLLGSAGVAAACLLVMAALVALRKARARPEFSSAGVREGRAGHRGKLGALRAGLGARLARFMTALAISPRPRVVAGIGAVALLSYALRTLGWLTLLAAAGSSAPWPVLLAIGPLVTIGAALPISVLGFGGFQAINVYLLGLWGVPAEQALAASLVQSGLAVLLYGIGCIAYLGGGRSRRVPLRATPTAESCLEDAS